MRKQRAGRERSCPRSSIPAHRPGQGGWIGLVGLLIALVIVAVLAQTVLKSYGLIGGNDRAAAAGSRVPPAAAPAEVDAAQPPPSRDPRERVRGLEQQVQRDAQDLSRRIDEQTK